MRRYVGMIVLTIVTGLLPAQGDTQEPNKTVLDTDILDKAIGKPGQNVEGIYKFFLPRTDLSVCIDEITLRPGLALGSWIAFKPTPQGAITHGDLVLREGEVGPVVRQLEQEGIMITALHNHLVRESPKMMYLHFWGEGKPETLASSLRAALNRTKTPIEKAEAPQGESTSDADDQRRPFSGNSLRTYDTCPHISSLSRPLSQSVHTIRRSFGRPRRRPHTFLNEAANCAT